MITVLLQGGLGNQLFQLAFLDYVCYLNNVQPFLKNLNNKSPHTNLNYFNTIFNNWKSKQIDIVIDKIITEPQNNWKIQTKTIWGIKKELNIQIIGFFQHYKYILSNFISKLDFSSSERLLLKYKDIESFVFIHIRGGDYLTPFHWREYGINTDMYYEKAITLFPKNTKFIIFTNDINYAKSKRFLHTIDYQFIDENEVDSLFLMSKCAGGICANSTFSWWGAYLNPNRKLILPAIWNLDKSKDSSGFYFPNAIMI